MKNKPIKISLSSSFMSKSKCSKCAGNPQYYFSYNACASARSFPFTQYDIFRMCNDYYLEETPREHYKMNSLKFGKTIINGYSPQQHMYFNASNFIEILMCKCYATTWVFTSKAITNRPEIFNRKSNRYYPQFFIKY